MRYEEEASWRDSREYFSFLIKETHAEKISAEITPFLSYLIEVKGTQDLEVLQPTSKLDRKVKGATERPSRAPTVSVLCPWVSVLAIVNVGLSDILRGSL